MKKRINQCILFILGCVFVLVSVLGYFQGRYVMKLNIETTQSTDFIVSWTNEKKTKLKNYHTKSIKLFPKKHNYNIFMPRSFDLSKVKSLRISPASHLGVYTSIKHMYLLKNGHFELRLDHPFRFAQYMRIWNKSAIKIDKNERLFQIRNRKKQSWINILPEAYLPLRNQEYDK